MIDPAIAIAMAMMARLARSRLDMRAGGWVIASVFRAGTSFKEQSTPRSRYLIAPRR